MELYLPLTQSMLVIQTSILDLMENTLRDIKRSNTFVSIFLLLTSHESIVIFTKFHVCVSREKPCYQQIHVIIRARENVRQSRPSKWHNVCKLLRLCCHSNWLYVTENNGIQTINTEVHNSDHTSTAATTTVSMTKKVFYGILGLKPITTTGLKTNITRA